MPDSSICTCVLTLLLVLCVRTVAEIMTQQEPLTYFSRRHGERSLGRGSIIVNLSSISSYIAAPGMLSYTASKHAVLGLTKSAGVLQI
jgi:NAD(P)-dependent dehydrogenase (short-subunit alcohol dehydrogenase family)